MDEETMQEEPMFFSSYVHTLDAQGRISFPGEWRRQAADYSFVLMPASGKALVLLPRQSFMEFLARSRKKAIANPAVQIAFARIGEHVRPCRCDKQGRMALDREMLARIGVTNNVKLIGALNHIRLTAPENWQVAPPEHLDGDLDELRKAGEGDSELLSLLQTITDRNS